MHDVIDPALPESKDRPSATLRDVPRILVVDDNRDAAQSLALLLDLHGYDVQTAFNGQETLQIIRWQTFDAVLLDIGMPDIDGLTLARHIRSRDLVPQPLLIAVTAWSSPEDRAASQYAGFDAHVVKPVEWDVLRQLLQGRH